ncbi:MAG TPA: response regulator [Longimicrobium sp.]|jgi:two-component system cell cycle response regulator DivK|uniref:response regulator n=1 Tax=Longimicrobium sp. TaxID=2029185 RepID=UPI002ED89FAA
MTITIAPERRPAAFLAGRAHPARPLRVVRRDAVRAAPDAAAGTVLVADAHEESRAVCAMLLRHNGFAVLEAATGEEAIRLAHAHHLDAIALGPVLRGVDGIRALEVLKQDPATASIPVVVLSSAPDSEHERRARAAGCAAYLPKPCPPRQVLNTLRALTGRREAA